MVDIEGRHVEVSQRGGESPMVMRDVVRWAPKVGAAPLEIDLVSLFVG
ncbi:MAG: hypothetical protein P3A28_02960 [Gemmatimonadota bacterium]|nr:hypothetical protein [Gemmatimonadota bacterium]